MGLTTSELAGIIAGSIAGVIVFSILGVILYMWLHHRRKGRRHSNKKSFSHHHLTPDISHSKHSGQPNNGFTHVKLDPRLDSRLDPRLDSRLPRVGSSNLWFGNPSLYSAVPSQVYQDMKRKSNTRQPKGQKHISAPPGDMLHQISNMNRIYHSQQMVPNIYQPDYLLARSGSNTDLYLYPYYYNPYRDTNNSQTMLLEYPEEEKYLDRYREREFRRTGKKVKRSQSDVTLHSTQRPKSRKQRGEGPFDRGKNSSKLKDSKSNEIVDRHAENGYRIRSNDRKINIESEKKIATLLPPTKEKEEIHVKSTKSSDTIVHESATDSAKLRAIEREKERQRESELVRKQPNDNSSVYTSDNLGFISDEFPDNDLHVRPYDYNGKPSKYENSVVAKMAALTDTPNATFVNRQNINDIWIVNHRSKDEFHAEVTKKLEILQLNKDTTPLAVDRTDGPVATSTGNHSRASRPSSSKDRRRSRRESGVTDQDGNVITEKAFEFLDGYLDDEGTDSHESGHTSPILVTDEDINL